MRFSRTLVDLFEIVPTAFPACSVPPRFRSIQRTLLDPYELWSEPVEPPEPYRSRQPTLVDPFERKKR